MRFIYHPEAHAEVVEAYQWYEGQKPGLGDRLLLEIEDAFGWIRDVPSGWRDAGVRGADIRERDLRRFPYRLIYERIDEHSTRVYAVVHHKRDRHYWLHRR